MSLKLLIILGIVIVIASLFYSFYHLLAAKKTGSKVLIPLAFRVTASIAILILAFFELSQRT
ncbi:MAG: hypothetical protein COA99_03260 [Moraxellaceae bacterium]|nr:MAG: hypothetical protein COA99_03260 [Moraxellaceae bacterium]